VITQCECGGRGRPMAGRVSCRELPAWASLAGSCRDLGQATHTILRFGGVPGHRFVELKRTGTRSPRPNPFAV
jgi:hypothetical protein